MTRRQSLLAGGIIVVAALAAYHNSFHGVFFFDDRVSITDNPSIQHLGAIGRVLNPPPVAYTVVGRPLFNLSFAINYALSGADPWSYHVVNLLIHILAGLTLFGIMRRTVGKAGPALAVALIWTVHPLQTEAVTYVSQRAESLMGLFYLLTLYCFIRSTDESEKGLQVSSFKFQIFSVAACLFGMATKEVMVTAPVMVFLYDRTFIAGSFRAAWRRRWRLYLGLAGTWLFLGYLMANFSAKARPSIGVGVVGSWWVYLLTECRVIVRYLGLAVWPHPLVFDYGIWRPRATWDLAPYVVVVVALAAGAAWALFGEFRISKFRISKFAGFAGAWFFIILAPTSSVVAVASQPMAEHRMYLPLAAVIAVAVVGFYTLLERSMGFQPMSSRGHGLEARATFIAGLTPVLAIIIICICLTVRRNEDYRSEIALWSDTVSRWPSSDRAQGNLGLALADQERWPEAIARYEEALRLAPDLVEVRYNLGYALFRSGRMPEAAAAYAQVVRQKPDYADAYNNLGNVLAEESRWPEAAAAYEQVLRLEPDSVQAHYNLGVVFAQQGRTAEAIAEFETVIRLDPDNAEARANLAQARGQQSPNP